MKKFETTEGSVWVDLDQAVCYFERSGLLVVGDRSLYLTPESKEEMMNHLLKIHDFKL